MSKEAYVIQSDIDDVITPANTAIRRAYNREYGTSISYQNGCEVMLESSDPQIRKFATSALRRSRFLRGLPLYPGVLSGSALLHENYFRLDLASGRLADLKAQMVEWVAKTGLSEYCGNFYSRPESEDLIMFKVLTALNSGVGFAIEDHPAVAQGYEKARIHVALIRRPWNKRVPESCYIKPVPSFLKACEMIVSYFKRPTLRSYYYLQHPETEAVLIPLSYTQSLGQSEEAF